MLGTFFINWFSPIFRLGTGFDVIIVAIWTLFAGAGVVPDLKGKAHVIHNFAAFGASSLLVPALLIIANSGLVNSFSRIFTAMAIVVMLGTVYAYSKKRQYRSRVLLYEAVFFLCFDISILVTTYVR